MFSHNIDWTQWFIASATVLALMGGFAGILKYIQQRRGAGLPLSSHHKSRLSVTETRLIDARNKVCIIKRDNTEYTVLITPNSATLLDTKGPTENA